MKARIDRKQLAEAANWVGLAVHKGHVATLSGLRITADHNTVTLAGFNYDTAHTAHVPAEVIAAGECLVSARFVTQMLGALRDDTVELVLDGNRLAITSGRSTYRAAVMNLEDYPTLPSMPDKVVAQVPADVLTAMVGTVEHAVARTAQSNVPADMQWLYAVGLKGDQNTLSTMAADRFRMAKVTTIPDKASDFTASAPLVPLQAALKGLTDGLTIAVDSGDGGMLGVTDGVRSVTMRLIDCPWPDLDKTLFLKKYDWAVETDAEDLRDALRRAVLLSEEKGLVRLDVRPGEIGISVDASTADGIDTVEADTNADEFTVYFNGAFLIQTLTAVTTSRVAIRFNDPRGQVGVEPIGDASTSFVVMPRRK